MPGTRAGRPGGRLPAEERIRQVVPAELQLRRRDFLPQHGAWFAAHDLGPRPCRRAGPCRRRGALFSGELDATAPPGLVEREKPRPAYSVSLGRLAELIALLHGRCARACGCLISATSSSASCTATYLSYLPTDGFAYSLEQKCDPRGCLAEFVKSTRIRSDLRLAHAARHHPRESLPPHEDREVSRARRARPIIRFRHILSGEVIEYPVRGEEFRVVDIPTGYTHSIENVGAGRAGHALLGERDLRSGVGRTRNSCRCWAHESRHHHRHASRDHPAVAGHGRAGPLPGPQHHPHGPELRLRAQPGLLRRPRDSQARLFPRSCRADCCRDHRAGHCPRR